MQRLPSRALACLVIGLAVAFAARVSVADGVLTPRGGTITGVNGGAGLSGGGTSGRVTLTLAPCPAGQVLQSAGSGAYVCALVAGGGGDVIGLDAGSGVLVGSPGGPTPIVSIDQTYTQRRVSTACAVGSAIRAIAVDGSVTCETDDDTTYSAGSGIVVGGTVVAIDPTYTQRRVSGSCTAGSSIRAIAQDGTVTCETDDGLTGTLNTGYLPYASAPLVLSDSPIYRASSTLIQIASDAMIGASATTSANGTPDVCLMRSTVSGTSYEINNCTAGTLRNMTLRRLFVGATSASLITVQSGAGSPEGVVTANPGSMWWNTSGGVGTTIYEKESGTGNTGWIANGIGDVTDVNATAGGGVAVTGSTGPTPSVGLITSCATNEILKWSGTAWTCAADANAGGDVTDVLAGTGIAVSSSSGPQPTVSANLAGASCTAGNFVSALSAAGAGTCTGEVGDIAGVTANAPISGGGTSGTVSIGLTACATNEIYKWNGTAWACSPDANAGGDVTDVTATSGGFLVSTNSTGPAPSLGLSTACATNEIPKWNGTAWACAADANGGGDVTDVTATANGGLAATNSSGPAPSLGLVTTCANGQLLKWTSGTPGSWGCASDTDTTYTATSGVVILSNVIKLLQTCATNEILKWNGTTWACAADVDSGGDLTAVAAGTGIAVTSGTGPIPTVTANLAGASCSAGQYMSALGATGTGTCTAEVGDISGVTANAPISGGGTSGAVSIGLTACATGEIYKWSGTAWACTADADSGGDITSVIAGTSLTGGATSGPATLNVSLPGASCSAGQFVSAISAGGTGTCGTPVGGGDITDVNATAGGFLVSTGSTGPTPSLGLSTACANGEIPKWTSGSPGSWGCAADANAGGDVTDVTATASGGLVATNSSGPAPSLGLITSCSSGQMLKWNGSAWACAADIDTDTNSGGDVTDVTATSGGGLVATNSSGPAPSLGLITSCSSTQVLKWNGSAWACAADSDSGGDLTAVTQGDGIVVTSGTGPVPTVAVNAATNTTTYNAFHAAWWGDSLTNGCNPTCFTVGGAVEQFGALSGYVMYNGGTSGDTSTQIRTRMIADTAKYPWPTIIWAGRNNFAASATVQSDIAAMVAALGHTNYIVLSIVNAENGSIEWSGGSDYNKIIALNSALSSTYGSHYLDVRAYLVSLYNAGIPQDVTDHGHDMVPSSLRQDAVHMNQAGYAAVAAYVYANVAKLQQGPVRPLVETNIPTILAGVIHTADIGGTLNYLLKSNGAHGAVDSSVSESVGLVNVANGLNVAGDASIGGNLTLTTAGKQVVFPGTNTSTIFNYVGSSSENTFVRGGKTASSVTIGDSNTGGVTIGAASNATSVAGTLGVTGLLTATAGGTTGNNWTTTGTGDLVSADDLTVADDASISDQLTVTGVTLGGAGFRNGSLTGPAWLQGTGSPEGVVTAPVGSTFSNTTGSGGTSFYIKGSGTGNTGWVSIGSIVTSITGTLTSGKVPRATGAATLADGSWSDTGSALSTSSTVSITGSTTLAQLRYSSIFPTAFSGTTSNWAPTGLAGATHIFTTNSATATITGITAQPAGTILVIENANSPGITLVFANATTSTATNQLALNGSVNWTTLPGDVITFMYVGGSVNRWVQIQNAVLKVPTWTVDGTSTLTGLVTATAGVTTPANLTTTSTGDLVSADDLTVADDTTLSDQLTCNGISALGNDTSDRLEVRGASGTISSPPHGVVDVIDMTSAAQGVGGQITFWGNYTGTTATIFGAITAYKESATVDGSQYGGALVFNTRTQGGADNEKMRITSDGIAIQLWTASQTAATTNGSCGTGATVKGGNLGWRLHTGTGSTTGCRVTMDTAPSGWQYSCPITAEDMTKQAVSYIPNNTGVDFTALTAGGYYDATCVLVPT